MAIEQYGESILAGVRSRQEQDRKRREKDELKTALAGLGVTIGYKVGNQALQNSFDTFMNSEPTLSAKARWKAGAVAAERGLAEQRAITSSGKSDYNYLVEDRLLPQVYAQLQEQHQLQDPIDSNSVFAAHARQIATSIADSSIEDYRKFLTVSQNLRTEDDFDAALELSAKKVRPNNLLSALGQKVSRVFSGKTREELDQEAIAAYSKLTENAESAALLGALFNKNLNIQEAYDFTKDILPEVDEKARFVTMEETNDFSIVGNDVYRYTSKKVLDRLTGTLKTTKEFADLDEETKKPVPVITDDSKKPETIQMLAVSKLQNGFNFVKDGGRELTPEAFAAFANEAKKTNLSVSRPKTIDEYFEIAALFDTFVTAPGNLKDNKRQELISNIVNGMLTQSPAMQALAIKALSAETADERSAALQSIFTQALGFEDEAYKALRQPPTILGGGRTIQNPTSSTSAFDALFPGGLPGSNR